jgi:hypothetical protein
MERNAAEMMFSKDAPAPAEPEAPADSGGESASEEPEAAK